MKGTWNPTTVSVTADKIQGKIQFNNTGKLVLDNCTFDLVAVSPYAVSSLEVKGCSFSGGLVHYGIKDVHAKKRHPKGEWVNDPDNIGNYIFVCPDCGSQLTEEERDVYTITWVVDGEETKEKVPFNEEFTYPTPKKTGYVFTGWYNEDGELVEDGTILNKDTTLTAQWEVYHAPMVLLFFGTTVRVYDADNGTITPNGIPMIIGGMTKTFKFIPDDGYAVADVIVNGESYGAVEALTLDGFSGYVTLTAVFEAVEP